MLFADAESPSLSFGKVTMMRHRLIAILVPLVVLTACEDDATDPGNECAAAGLPLSGAEAAPTIVEVGLEVQTGYIVVLATATDPQGSENLFGVLQSVGVFPDLTCAGAPIVLQDDLVGSGVQETFGTAVDAQVNPALYDAISSATFWPVEVDFRDQDGNRTSGRVLASVVH